MAKGPKKPVKARGHKSWSCLNGDRTLQGQKIDQVAFSGDKDDRMERVETILQHHDHMFDRAQD